MKLFCDNSANRSNNIYEQHSVVVWFNYGLEEDEPFFELDDRLRKKIEESGTGLYDGHEIAMDNSDGSFYFYGPSAEDLYNTILPILHSYQFMKGATAHLRFGPSIENARIIEIDI